MQKEIDMHFLWRACKVEQMFALHWDAHCSVSVALAGNCLGHWTANVFAGVQLTCGNDLCSVVVMGICIEEVQSDATVQTPGRREVAEAVALGTATTVV